MTPKALRLRLEGFATERGLRISGAAMDRRLRVLLAEADGDAAHVELVVRWCLAQQPITRMWGGPRPDEFWAVSHKVDCPEGAWAYRLVEYELALSEQVGGLEYKPPSKMLSSITHWLGYWSDAEAILDTNGVAYAREMLDKLVAEVRRAS